MVKVNLLGMLFAICCALVIRCQSDIPSHAVFRNTVNGEGVSPRHVLGNGCVDRDLKSICASTCENTHYLEIIFQKALDCFTYLGSYIKLSVSDPGSRLMSQAKDFMP